MLTLKLLRNFTTNRMLPLIYIRKFTTHCCSYFIIKLTFFNNFQNYSILEKYLGNKLKRSFLDTNFMHKNDYFPGNLIPISPAREFTTHRMRLTHSLRNFTTHRIGITYSLRNFTAKLILILVFIKISRKYILLINNHNFHKLASQKKYLGNK